MEGRPEDNQLNRLKRILDSSSSSVGWAGGIPRNALQPTEAYCSKPAFWFPSLSPEALHVRRGERPISAKGGTMDEKWPVKFSLKNATYTSLQGSLTCRKTATWDRRLYFPSEGRHAEDFFAQKI
jgi:hypothetical protein